MKITKRPFLIAALTFGLMASSTSLPSKTFGKELPKENHPSKVEVSEFDKKRNDFLQDLYSLKKLKLNVLIPQIQLDNRFRTELPGKDHENLTAKIPNIKRISYFQNAKSVYFTIMPRKNAGNVSITFENGAVVVFNFIYYPSKNGIAGINQIVKEKNIEPGYFANNKLMKIGTEPSRVVPLAVLGGTLRALGYIK